MTAASEILSPSYSLSLAKEEKKMYVLFTKINIICSTTVTYFLLFSDGIPIANRMACTNVNNNTHFNIYSIHIVDIRFSAKDIETGKKRDPKEKNKKKKKNIKSAMCFECKQHYPETIA